MQRIAFASSPWGFRKTPLEKQCQWLKANGLKYICNACGPDALTGLFRQDISNRDIAKALARVRRYGLKFASFNADGDFSVSAGLESQLALCCMGIERGARFGAKVIIVFAGWQPRTDDAVYDQISAALTRVARYAAQFKLTVALENHGGLTRTAEQCTRILGKVRAPNIGLNYDPANFLMHGEDPLRALKKLKCPIAFTHFKSVKRVGGKKVYCRIDEGEIDYVPILRLLRQRRYQGFYTLEYEEAKDVFAGSKDDLAALKRAIQAAAARR